MRKLCVLLLCATLVLGGTLAPATAAVKTSVSSSRGGQLELTLRQRVLCCNMLKHLPPSVSMLKEKQSLAPVGSIVNKLGGKLDFDKKAKRLTLAFGKTEIILHVGKTQCYINGKLYTLPIAPVQKGNNGTVFVPIRWLAEVLGVKVNILPNGKIVIRGKWKHEKPTEPEPPTKTTKIGFQELPHAKLRAEILHTDPQRPLLWYGPAANLLEKPTTALKDKNVLVISRGWQGSTGYDIRVQSLQVNDGELRVQVRLIDPEPGSGQATVMQYIYQVLTLADELPPMDSWRIETVTGNLLNAKQLTDDVAYQVATGVDVSWAELEVPGVAVKPVKVKGQDRLLVVFKRGAVPTTGYGIDLQSLSLEAWGSLTAQVKYSYPAPGSFQAQVISYPYQAVYLDPIYIGHEFNLVLVNKVWDQLVTVPRTLKADIDCTRRGVIVGYGRDLLSNPGGWSDKLLLVAKRGYCPTGGYSISVESLVCSDNNLVLVNVIEKDPAPGADVTMAITYPYHIVELPPELAQCEFKLSGK